MIYIKLVWFQFPSSERTKHIDHYARQRLSRGEASNIVIFQNTFHNIFLNITNIRMNPIYHLRLLSLIFSYVLKYFLIQEHFAYQVPSNL